MTIGIKQRMQRGVGVRIIQRMERGVHARNERLCAENLKALKATERFNKKRLCAEEPKVLKATERQ